MKKTIVKNTGIIGLATAASRVLGFVRDMVIANFFGTAVYAQAFVVAFRIPNLLRDLVGEGAVNAALVPVLTDELTKKGKKEFFSLAQVVFNILILALAALAIIGIFSSNLIVGLIAPGFGADKEKFEITVTLTRVLFPFLVLVGLWAYAMGLLNSLGHFALPAFGPVALNLSMILCAMWFGENVFGLAAGVLAGGILQFVIQMPPLFLNGWKMRLTRNLYHPKAVKIGILLIPRAIGACVYQVNVFISTILASLSSIVGEGAVAALYYANRIWQLPLAVFGIALAQAALPAMSRHVALNDIGRLKETCSFSLRILLFILLPSSVGLMVLARPITTVLFERGMFTSYSTSITASALFFYAMGLVACGGIKILISVFYSLQDTVTPVKTALASLVLNIILNIAFMGPLRVGGLALATSISAFFNFSALYFMLEKKIGNFDRRSIIDTLIRVASASAVMGFSLIYLSKQFFNYSIMRLSAMLIIGIAIFLASSLVFRVKELLDFIKWISKK